MPADDVVTDFSGYTLEQLNQMLDQSSPASAVNAAQMWESAGNLLHEQAQNLEIRLSSLGPSWRGSAAADYQRMITDLIGGIKTVGDTAFQMRDVMYSAADALDTARAQMPPPVDVPSVSPATVAMATTPVQVPAGASPQAVAQLQQQQAAAVQAVQQQQTAVAAAASAQAKAVAVMQALAGSYRAAQDSIPPSPAATVPAAHGPGPSGVASTPGSAGLPPAPATTLDASSPAGTMPGATQSGPAAMVGGTGGQPAPLFGNMFTVGLAAVAAVAAGRFGSLMPSVPAFARRRQGRNGNGQPGGGTPQLGAAAAAGAWPGAAAATAGLSAGAATAGPGAAAPTAGPGMAGASPGQLTDLAASNAAGAAAGGPAGGEPVMPMMPMGGMAGAGLGNTGGARRTPPWLVQTQDVWGESVPAAPGLIG